MRTLLLTFVTLVLFSLMPIERVRAQGPGSAELDLVAKYMDQTAIGVVRVDMSRFDTDAIINDVARTLADSFRERDPDSLGVVDQQLKQAREDAKKWRARFAAAGGRDIYMIVIFNPSVETPVIGVVPTAAGAKIDELIAMLGETTLPFMRDGRAVEGGIVTGPESLMAGLPLAEPTRRDELVRELKRAGDAPVQLALIPAEFVRRAIEENVTELPAELGGGPVTVLTKGVVSGAGSISVAPNWAVRIVLQSESEEAAQALAATLQKALDGLKEKEGADPALMQEMVAALAPRAEGNVVIIALGNERIASFKKMLAPAFMRARLAARRAISGSRMRNSMVGCMIYANDNKKWPADLQTLVKEGHITEDELVNPDRPDVKPGYIYIRPDMEQLNKTDWSEHMVIHEAFDQWPKEGVWAAYADGHVQMVLDPEAFKKLLEYAKKNQAK